MLGIDLSEALRRDCTVYGADLAPHAKSRLTRFYRADITDRAGIAAVIAKARPDIVIHCAAWTDVDGCELDPEKAMRVNGRGAANVAAACCRSGAALVYISTDFVFDGRKRRPYLETDRPRPLSVYGKSKLAGEIAVRKALQEHVILRTSWLYGANGKNFVDTIIAKGRTEKLLKVVDDQCGSPTYTKDLALAIRRLIGAFRAGKISRGRYGIYHVSNTGKVSWCRYAKTILKFAGVATPVLPISSEALARPAQRPAMSVLDTKKFAALTKKPMRNWREALKDYIRNEKKLKGRAC